MSENIGCYFCDSLVDAFEREKSAEGVALFSCPHCGNYGVPSSFSERWLQLLSEYSDARPKISHAIRRSNGGGQKIIIDIPAAEAILKQPLPRPKEQADLLLRWIAENVPGPGELVWVDYISRGAVVGSKSDAGFGLILDHLFENKFVTGNRSRSIGRNGAHITPTFMGWDYYEDLRRGSKVYRKAFMAMKFGNAQLDTMLETVFKPCALKAGFELFKSTDIQKAGLIDNHMRAEIQGSDFVVADLSHDNLGAYWEAGYAEGLGKPVIYTCEKSKFDLARTHFDTNHHLTIIWDMENPGLCGKELTATIRATLPHIAILMDEKNAG